MRRGTFSLRLRLHDDVDMVAAPLAARDHYCYVAPPPRHAATTRPFGGVDVAALGRLQHVTAPLQERSKVVRHAPVQLRFHGRSSVCKYRFRGGQWRLIAAYEGWQRCRPRCSVVVSAVKLARSTVKVAC